MDEPANGQLDSTEAPPVPVELPHRTIGGFWRRLASLILDGLILGLVGSVCGLLMFDQLARLGIWGRVVGFLVGLAYFGILNSAIGKGQTLGKRLMGIEVIDRSGRHISLPRSLLRYAIVGVPFFLKGAMIPTSVMMSPIGYTIGFVIFGFGGAIIYLYVFNRRTRQSLHDLLVGSFVTKTTLQGEVAGSVWRPHLVVVGAWVVTVIGLSVVLTNTIRGGVFPGLFDVQQAIQSSGKVHVASVTVGRSWQIVGGSRSEATFFCSTAVWKRRPEDSESAARSIASIILQNYPEVAEKDVLTVIIAYGFDIGIANCWKSYTSSRSPWEWQQLVGEDTKE